MTEMKTWTTADGVRHWADTGYQAALIPMAARGKARPRVTENGTYMPAEYQRARQVLRVLFGPVTVRMPIAVKMTAVRQMPASWSARKRQAMAWAMDSLLEDDAGVVWIECIKVWGPCDWIKLELMEVNAAEAAVAPEELGVATGIGD